MSVKLYMDVHVRRAVTDGLRLRQVDTVTAQEDGASELPDAALLDRARTLGRVLFTKGGECVADLKLIAKAYRPEDMIDRVEFLPL